MADYQIRAASVFVEGRKVGQFYDGTYSIQSGDEPNFGDNGGDVVYSDGIITTSFRAKVYEPIQGLDFDIEGALLNKTNLNIGLGLINGKIHQVKMRPLEGTHTTEWRNGKLEGEFNFGGGKPQRI